jgi:hypothetical protein
MKVYRKLIWIFVFGIAFGLVEAAIVVYLRKLYYPDGFQFPLKMVPFDVLFIEVVREVATIAMLIAFGALTGRTKLAKFSAFIIAFGVWDIFYYVWLKVFLGWPETLLDWDILFLIPTLWVAPVLAPILVSAGLIGCGTWMFLKEESGDTIRATAMDWGVEIVAATLIVASFIINSGIDLPDNYPWWLFLLGLLGGVSYFIWRGLKR